jgi:hypothetical protein
MELKVKEELLARLGWQGRIHSMELKESPCRLAGALKTRRVNPFNGIESVQQAYLLDVYEPGIHSMELKDTPL